MSENVNINLIANPREGTSVNMFVSLSMSLCASSIFNIDEFRKPAFPVELCCAGVCTLRFCTSPPTCVLL